MKSRNQALLAFAALGLAVAGTSRANAEDAAAVVNNEAISKGEFDKDWSAFVAEQKKVMPADRMTPDWEEARKMMMLNKLIEKRLVLQEARKEGIEVTQKDVDAAIAQVKARFKVDAKGNALSSEQASEAFQNMLAKQNVTESQFEADIRNQLLAGALVNKLMKQNVKPPTDEQIRALYDKVAERMSHPTDPARLATEDQQEQAIDGLARYFKLESAERVRVQHILVKVSPKATEEERAAAKKKADDIKAQLDDGAKFGELAVKYSDDKATAKKQGDAGFVARGEIKELDNVLFSLPLGGISPVTKTKLGYDIFRAEEKRVAQDIDYPAAKRFLADQLMRQAQREEYEHFVDGLRKAAAIDIRLSLGKTASLPTSN